MTISPPSPRSRASSGIPDDAPLIVTCIEYDSANDWTPATPKPQKPKPKPPIPNAYNLNGVSNNVQKPSMYERIKSSFSKLLIGKPKITKTSKLPISISEIGGGMSWRRRGDEDYLDYDDGDYANQAFEGDEEQLQFGLLPEQEPNIEQPVVLVQPQLQPCLLYTSPSPRD